MPNGSIAIAGDQLPFLRIAGLTKMFGGLSAVRNVDLEVQPHQVFGIIGPNGAGKTTMFNLISGIYPPTAGRIVFRGEDITNLKCHHMTRKGIARTFQALYLFSELTALENVLVGHHSQLQSGLLRSILHSPGVIREERVAVERARDWLTMVGLSGKENVIAGGLSYGEQIVVGIARALASEPKLLLLDEPAGGLTYSESEKLMRLVEQIVEHGITVLLIEHRMHFLMNLAHEILVIDHGESICQGTPEEVKRDARVIEAYLGRE